MKIISWNVNGIRAGIRNGFLKFIEREKPEIICIQETKAHPDQVDEILKDYPHHFWHSAVKKGYSGTAVFSKIEPLKVIYGNEFHRVNEGRVLILEFEEFFLVNVYTMNSKALLARLDERQEWDKNFLKLLNSLDSKKPVVFCGDLNVAHKEIDIKNPKANEKNAGFTKEERNAFSKLLDSGFKDTFRELHPEEIKYSWWSYRFNARAKNIGWRIDYFGVSNRLMKKVKSSEILSQITGSDHCPLELDIKI